MTGPVNGPRRETREAKGATSSAGKETQETKAKEEKRKIMRGIVDRVPHASSCHWPRNNRRKRSRETKTTTTKSTATRSTAAAGPSGEQPLNHPSDRRFRARSWAHETVPRARARVRSKKAASSCFESAPEIIRRETRELGCIYCGFSTLGLKRERRLLSRSCGRNKWILHSKLWWSPELWERWFAKIGGILKFYTRIFWYKYLSCFTST